jgi:dihydrofolate reductase
MGNGTVFHFVTGGIREAFELAENAAGSQDVRIGGGAYTIQQFMNAGLLDELHVARIPIKLNAGEKLFSNPSSQLAGYVELPEVVSDSVVHVRYVKS